jgi:DHA2 family multidrug resistance protein
MTDAVLSPSRSRVGGSPWVVAAAVVVPTFMEMLDTTITLVALRYVAGCPRRTRPAIMSR